VIQVTGGVIVGASAVPARTVLKETASIAATKLKVFNSRFFPDAFTGTVSTGLGTSEIITVSANDRENSVLTLSAGLAASHPAGVRVEANSPPEFVPERTTPALPTSGTTDARPRYWQADEDNGHFLSQDPYTTTGRADVQVKNLKEQVDFLAAQLRELKFGSGAAATIGTTVPPSSFAAAPRYFEYGGSVQGSKMNVASVGDGVNTWGDFNVAQMADARTAIQAAVDAVGTEGVVFIKGGTYNIGATPVTVSHKQVRFIGEGSSKTIIRANGAAAAVLVTKTLLIETQAIFEDLQLKNQAHTHALEVISSCGISTLRCLIGGVAGTGTANTGVCEDTIFTSGATGTGYAWKLNVTDTVFTKCQFSPAQGATQIGLGSTSGTVVRCHFLDCDILGFTHQAIDTNINDSKFDRCNISAATLGAITGILTNCTLVDTRIESTSAIAATIVISNNLVNCTLERCAVALTVATGGGLIRQLAADVSIASSKFLDCSFSVPAGAALSVMMRVRGDDFMFRGCTWTGGTAGCDGVSITTASSNGKFNDCVYTAVGSFVSATVAVNGLSIRGCRVNVPAADTGIDLGASVTTNAKVIDNLLALQGAPAVSVSKGIVANLTYSDVSGNKLENLDYGISLTGMLNCTITNNKIVGLVAARCLRGIEATSNGGRSIIANNLIDSMVGTLELTHKGISVFLANALYDLTIADNTIIGVGSPVSLDIQYIRVESLVDGTLESNTVVTGNTCRGNGLTGIPTTLATTATRGFFFSNIGPTNAGPINVSNNNFSEIGGTGVFLEIQRSIGIVVSNNVFKNLHALTSVGSKHVYVSGAGNRDITITGNTFTGLGGTNGATDAAIWVEAQKSLNISNNVIRTGNSSIDGISVHGPASGTGLQNVSICGNTIDTADEGIEIILQGTVAGVDRNINVSNNLILTFVESGIVVDGTLSTSPQQATVNGNTVASVSNTATQGIVVESMGTAIVTGNTVAMTAGAPPTAVFGILVTGCALANVSGNVTQGTFGSTPLGDGISVTGGTYFAIFANMVSGPGGAGAAGRYIQGSGANGYIASNIVVGAGAFNPLSVVGGSVQLQTANAFPSTSQAVTAGAVQVGTNRTL
jgi:hypothetical protein